jgi:hypothetical protein
MTSPGRGLRRRAPLSFVGSNSEAALEGGFFIAQPRVVVPDIGRRSDPR